MSHPSSTVAVSILGSRLDSGRDQARWNRWRPNVAMFQHEDLSLAGLELLYQPEEQALAELIASDVALVSPETTVRLHAIPFPDPWDFESTFACLHEFARGFPWQPELAEYLFHITTGSHVQQICLFLLAESRHLPGKMIQTSPPPRDQAGVGTYRVIDLDLSKYDAIARRFALEQQEGLDFLKSGIATRNERFNQLIERIERVAVASTSPLLLTGPTGAGKSQLASRIYALKQRRSQIAGAFVEANCATLRGDQAMSALFGHVKGAFTGATVGRIGLLKSADKGMLFLDEIGELGTDEQAMLLRAVEEKRFLPVGADKEVSSDFQLMAGTNRDLQADVKSGRFREDLLARINLWTFCLPGLAERCEDIAPNLDYELDRFAARTGQRVTMNKEARQRFLQFAESAKAAWPANFRDLNAAVTRMATLAHGGRITVAEVDEEVERLQVQWSAAQSDDSLTLLRSVLPAERLDAIDPFDLAQLAAVIHICRRCNSLSEAGRTLFAVSRLAKSGPNDADRLRKFLARFGLAWGDVRE